MTSNSYPLLSRNCSCCCCGDRCCVASYMVTDFVELFSVAVELPLLSHAIILSLSCSSLELIPLNVTTTQEHWGSDKVTSRITRGGEYGQSLNFFSKSFLLQLLFCLLIPIWNSFVSVVIVIGFCLSEWYNRLCENWAGVR